MQFARKAVPLAMTFLHSAEWSQECIQHNCFWRWKVSLHSCTQLMTLKECYTISEWICWRSEIIRKDLLITWDLACISSGPIFKVTLTESQGLSANVCVTSSHAHLMASTWLWISHCESSNEIARICDTAMCAGWSNVYTGWTKDSCSDIAQQMQALSHVLTQFWTSAASH